MALNSYNCSKVVSFTLSLLYTGLSILKVYQLVVNRLLTILLVSRSKILDARLRAAQLILAFHRTGYNGRTIFLWDKPRINGRTGIIYGKGSSNGKKLAAGEAM